MLLETAVADAYGIAFEFTPNTSDRPNDLSRYYQHPEYDGLKPGQYTDDTQRALANVNVMMTGGAYDARRYAQEYIDILRKDPRDGYSRRYQAFLESTFSPKGFIRTIKRGSSNGSIMGVAPLGYLESPGEVILAAGIQAYTTHSLATIPYAQGVALAAHYFLHTAGMKHDLVEYLQTHIPQVAEDTANIPVAGMSARGTYHAMLEGLRRHDNLADIIRWAVDRGGDTDSVAAVTVAVASCSNEFEKNIPEALIQGLEDGPYGRRFLIQRDKSLQEEFMRSSVPQA